MNDPDARLSTLLHQSAPEPPVMIVVADIARRVRSRRKQALIAPLAAATLVAVVAVILALAASGPEGRSSGHDAPAAGPSTTGTRTTSPASAAGTSLPATVDGVPVAALARQALARSVAWSEPHPTHVRLVVAREADVNTLFDGQRYGSTAKQYVIELDGLFTCRPPGCVTSGVGRLHQGSTAPTNPTGPDYSSPLIRMIVTIPVPGTAGTGASEGLQVDRRDLDIATLGHVIDLQPYIRALE